ncbi:SDH family Clp fold serine proteinase [Bradyrhizobium sp. AZCC 2230]|uniref:SDH family Clp fold serine proteinase n=1 Tax=Bradyrhizobium sp. AZCC 2230 TaxID=3117021 RepID=UPI002FF3A46E
MAKSPTRPPEAPSEGPKPPDSVPETSGTATGPSDGAAAPELTWSQALRADNLEAFKKGIAKELNAIISRHKHLDGHEVLFLFDDDSITNYHSDRLYAAARQCKSNGKDILLVIDSPGGSIEPAYLISKTLKRLTAKKFIAAVPRRAKSAATLICLGADEIHMGMISQLGPIDPQISGLPALALGNALRHIADLAEAFPRSSRVLSAYLIDQAPMGKLGYYERVSESAVQYAERLLRDRSLPNKNPSEVASHLVHHYKDHGFVIDSEEATGLLGADLVKEQTPEYVAADEIYSFVSRAQLVARYMNNKEFWIIGRPDEVGWRNLEK